MNKLENLHFRGNRTYLHSTTLLSAIFDQMDNSLLPAENIDFVMHRISDKQCHFSENKPENLNNLIATYRDDNHRLFVVQEETPLTERFPYDEEAVIGNYTINDDTIEVPYNVTSPYPAIEVIVSGFKQLLLNCQKVQPYLFSRLIIEKMPTTPFTITFKRIISNTFYEGDILVGDKKIGKIYFGIQVSS